jgi:glycerate 2-kinase
MQQPEPGSARALILGAYQAALDAVNPERATAGEIESLVASHAVPDEPGSIDVVAIGKAAIPMARGCTRVLGRRCRRVLAITKEGHANGEILPDWQVHVGAHPVPDQRSVDATDALLSWLAQESPVAATICLISGGGSALLERPRPGISLADMQMVTRSLLNAGADIHALNAVRSQLSAVKGGQLRSAIRSRMCLSLLLSDVLGNHPTVIASGPTIPIKTTRKEAIEILDRFNLLSSVPKSVRVLLESEESTQPAAHQEDIVRIVGDNVIALEAARTWFASNGLQPVVVWQNATGEARVRARGWVESLTGIDADVDAVLGGGELTVTVRGQGKGGRNTEFVLSAALALAEVNLPEWTVASLATDGQDALTGLAGAIADAASVVAMRTAGIDPEEALVDNDSATALAAIGATVETGPTGTNVNDLYFAIRSQATMVL